MSKDLEEGLAILREVLAMPRFQEDKIALRKQQTLQSMKERNDDSSAIEGREQGFLAYGENFWDNHYSTAASVAIRCISWTNVGKPTVSTLSPTC